MSHFSLLVKLTGERLHRHNGIMEDALHEIMKPYQDHSTGTVEQRFLQFVACTEEIEEYASETVSADSFLGKECPQHVGKTIGEVYGGFDGVAKEYFGYEKYSDNGQYGYWTNPNAQWDWYVVGGRFSNKLPNAQTLESCDVCRRRDLNLTLLQERAHSVAEKFGYSDLSVETPGTSKRHQIGFRC